MDGEASTQQLQLEPLDKLWALVYNICVIKVLQTETFRRWLGRLRDDRAVVSIATRLERIARGNIGDVRPLGGGVSELRTTSGPGYRLYFIRRGAEVIVLLCGGDKGSQSRDIERAKRMATEWRD